MGIKKIVNADGVKYLLGINDLSGKRRRLTFETKAEAEAYQREIKLRRKDLVARPANSSTMVDGIRRATLKEAIHKYVSTISVKKEADEKLYFTVMYDFLTDIFLDEEKTTRLTYVDHIELYHLQQLQTHLATVRQHSHCKDKDKKPRALEWCEANKELCRGRVLAASTVNRYFNTYREFFSQCRLWKHTKVNEIRDLGNLPEQTRKKKIMADADIQKVLNRAPKWAAGPWLVMIQMGARPCELKRLNWSDIDFNEQALHLWSKKGDGTLKERVVLMSEDVLEYLREQYARARRSFKAQSESAVFLTPKGKRLNSKALARLMRKIITELGFEGYTPYGFRHRFVTKGRKLKVGDNTIKDMVGHSNTIMQRDYSHMDVEDQRDAMMRINHRAPRLNSGKKCHSTQM